MITTSHLMKPTVSVLRLSASLLTLIAAFAAHADGMPDSQPASAVAGPAHKKPIKTKRVRDPLAVDATLAVRETDPKEIRLPGVMRLEGADARAIDPTRVQQVSISNPGIKTVWLSVNDPNRIQLPFTDARIISTNELEIDKRAGSPNIYVTFGEGVTRPVQVFLESKQGQVVGLRLEPKRIPAQTVVVIDDAGPGADTAAKLAGDSEYSYFSTVQRLLSGASLNTTLPGFSTVAVEGPPTVVRGLLVEIQRRLTNSQYDIYVYGITNTGSAPVLVNEQEFDDDNVLGVSVFPRPYLQPGEKSLVVVLCAKQGLGGARGNR